MELELGEEEALGEEGADGMRVWQPGMEEGDAELELEFDPSAYDCLHAMRLEWPCLRYAFCMVHLVSPSHDATAHATTAAPLTRHPNPREIHRGVWRNAHTIRRHPHAQLCKFLHV